MADYNFKTDFIIGKFGEYCWLRVLEGRGSLFKKISSSKEYDLVVFTKAREVKYEIKTDVYCYPCYETYNPIEKRMVEIGGKDTGNLFIEDTSYGRPSGINVCKADWFVYYYPYLGEFWVIKLGDLKGLIAENEFDYKSYSGDEGSNTGGWVIPRNNFRDKFYIINVNKLPCDSEQSRIKMKAWLNGVGGDWLYENDRAWLAKFGIPYLEGK